MPLVSSTSGPFEPSPGYGPAVSSGISADGRSATAVALALADADADGVEVVPLVALELVVGEALLVAAEHAARVTAPAPRPTRLRMPRREMRVRRSKETPWSTTSSSARSSSRPSYAGPSGVWSGSGMRAMMGLLR